MCPTKRKERPIRGRKDTCSYPSPLNPRTCRETDRLSLESQSATVREQQESCCCCCMSCLSNAKYLILSLSLVSHVFSLGLHVVFLTTDNRTGRRVVYKYLALELHRATANRRDDVTFFSSSLLFSSSQKTTAEWLCLSGFGIFFLSLLLILIC